jgi:hypothetical protein
VDGFAKDLVIRETLLYALDQPNGLNVFEVSSAGALAVVGTTTLPVPIPLRSQLEVSSAPKPRIAAVAGLGPIQIFDVSDMRKPMHVTTYRPGVPAQRIAMQGTQLYVAAGPAGLQVLDLVNPSMPVVVGVHQTGAAARDVAVSGSLVFLVSGPDSIVILRRS